MNTYLKIGISMGLPFGAIMASVYYFNVRGDIFVAVVLGGVAGIFFGAFMAGAFAAIGYLSGEGVAYGKTNWSQILELGIDLEEAKSLCRRSLGALNRPYKIDSYMGNQTQIVARTGMTWRSFGEIISYKVSSLTNSSVHIDICSKPKLASTTHDWGANRRNIDAIMSFIEATIEPEKTIRSERIEPK